MDKIRKKLEELKVDYQEDVYNHDIKDIEEETPFVDDYLLTTPKNQASGDYLTRGRFFIDCNGSFYGIDVVDCVGVRVNLFADGEEEDVIEFLELYFKR